MPINFLGMYPKTSYKVFNIQAQAGHLPQTGPQVVAGAPLVSHKAVYQDAYRKAEANLLRQKKKQKEIINTKMETAAIVLEEPKITNEGIQQVCMKHGEEIARLVDAQAQTLVAIEEHRRINANLNVALTTESARKQTLEKEKAALKRALKVSVKQNEDMTADKIASEKVIARAFRELADVRSEADSDKRRLQDEVVLIRKDKYTTEIKLEAAIEEIMGLSAHLDESNRAYLIAQRDLDATRSELAVFQSKHADCEAEVVILRSGYDTLSMDYDKAVGEKTSLELTLVQAQQMIEREMTSMGETAAALRLEQEKAKALESQLTESAALLASANERTAALEAELAGLKDEDDARSDISEESELAWSISMFALEIERDMHQAQELEALEALEAEKEARLALEKELALYRKKEQRTIEADKNTVVQPQTALNALSDEVQAETDLEDEDDAQSDISEESELAWSISMFALEIERDMHQAQELEALEALETEKEARIALEKELALYREKEQRALEADEDKENMAVQLQTALNTISELTEAIRAEKDFQGTISSQLAAERDAHANTCDALQSLKLRLASPARERGIVQQWPFTTPTKLSRKNKENFGIVFQTPTTSRFNSQRFGDIAYFANAPATPQLPNPFLAAATQPFDYFTNGNAAYEYACDVFDDIMPGFSSPAMS